MKLYGLQSQYRLNFIDENTRNSRTKKQRDYIRDRYPGKKFSHLFLILLAVPSDTEKQIKEMM